MAAAGGIIIQAMPNAEDAVLDDLEEKLKTARPVSSLIAEGAAAQDIVANYLPGTEIQFLEEKPIQWHCNCNRERISGLLKSIGIAELEDILEKDGQTDVAVSYTHLTSGDTGKAALEGFKNVDGNHQNCLLRQQP